METDEPAPPGMESEQAATEGIVACSIIHFVSSLLCQFLCTSLPPLPPLPPTPVHLSSRLSCDRGAPPLPKSEVTEVKPTQLPPLPTDQSSSSTPSSATLDTPKPSIPQSPATSSGVVATATTTGTVAAGTGTVFRYDDLRPLRDVTGSVLRHAAAFFFAFFVGRSNSYANSGDGGFFATTAAATELRLYSGGGGLCTRH